MIFDISSLFQSIPDLTVIVTLGLAAIDPNGLPILRYGIFFTKTF